MVLVNRLQRAFYSESSILRVSLYTYTEQSLQTSAPVAISSAASDITPSVWNANTHSSRAHTAGFNIAPFERHAIHHTQHNIH